jgi:membrane-bound inhibitor of C-type lysozyme
MTRFCWSSFPVLFILPPGCVTIADDQVHPLVCRSRTLEVTFVGEDASAAIVRDGDALLRLPQAMSASGARYADEARGAELWIKGGEAMVTLPGRERETCRFASRE